MQSDDFQDDEAGETVDGDGVVHLNAGRGVGDNSKMSKKRQTEFRRRFKEIQEAEAEAKAASDEVKELYRAAKEAGFNVKAMRHVASWRKKDEQAWLDFESEVDQYRNALPKLPDQVPEESA